MIQDAQALAGKIATLEGLRDVIRTMKALSSANLRQSEATVDSLVSYDRTIELGLHTVLRDEPLAESAVRTHKLPPGLIAIAFGTDYGLCGRLNQSLVEHTIKQLEQAGVPKDARHLIAVGSRIATHLADAGQSVDRRFQTPASSDAIVQTVERLLTDIDQLREQTGIERVWLFYNEYTLRTGSHPVTEHLLPVDSQRLAHVRQISWPGRRLPTYSLERQQLLASLVRQMLFVALTRACAQALASEHQARLLATQAAERNIQEALEQTSAEHRMLRQQAITAEILDVISGYEASSVPPP